MFNEKKQLHPALACAMLLSLETHYKTEQKNMLIMKIIRNRKWSAT
jgi:hypothetical protein